jgi:predicted CXXCH cytochrome family protein
MLPISHPPFADRDCEACHEVGVTSPGGSQ